MKKVFIVICLLLVIIYGNVLASPAALNFDNLPEGDATFEELFLAFGNAFNAISYCDIQNKAEKLDELETAKNLLAYLDNKAQNQPLNYDEEILSLLVMRCLYNFDEIPSEKIENLFLSLNEKYPDKAEHHWIYGNFVASMGNAIKAKTELETYMKMKNYYINHFFISDYSYVQYLCGMPLNAYYTITNGGNISENEVNDQQKLFLIKNTIKEPSLENQYSANEVWRFSGKEDDFYYLYSTMLGISFPVKGDWNVQYSQFSQTSPAMCMIKVNDFTLNEKPLSITILILAYPESFYTDDIKANVLNGFPITTTESIEIDEEIFTKSTYEDLSKYNDARKGAKGYIFSGKIEPLGFDGARVEHEIDLYSLVQNRENKSNPTYYAFTPTYKRIDEPMNYIILVDSCNVIAEETQDLINELFEKVRFD